MNDTIESTAPGTDDPNSRSTETTNAAAAGQEDYAAPRSDAPTSALRVPRSKRVLVVDDERCIRLTFRAFLGAEGHDVSVAEDAEQALDLIGKGTFDLIVSDLVLPRLNGLELCRRIRSLAPGTKVVLMTGEPTDTLAAEAAKEGVFRFLPKPVTREILHQTVAEALQSGGRDDETV